MWMAWIYWQEIVCSFQEDGRMKPGDKLKLRIEEEEYIYEEWELDDE